MKNKLLLCLAVSMLFAAAAHAGDSAAPAKDVTPEATAPAKDATKEKTPKGEKKMIAKKGDKVKVQYEGSTSDGKVFDKSKEDAPLGFEVGAGQMIKGFDKAVEGMKLNEEKTVTFSAEEGYGKRDERNVITVKKDFFPKDMKITKGQELSLQDRNGIPHRAIVAEVTDDGAKLDLNHFLAGKELTFKIKLVSIE